MYVAPKVMPPFPLPPSPPEMTTVTQGIIILFDKANSHLTRACMLLIKISTSRDDSLSLLSLLKCTTHSANIHCWVSINIQQASGNANECHFFFCTEEFSVTHLYLICISTSDAILLDCPSAAIWHKTTVCSGILVGRFNLYCHTTNTCLWHCGLT